MRKTTTKIWCDRCGKEIENDADGSNLNEAIEQLFNRATIEINEGPDCLGDTYDLCKDCHKELLKWLGKEKEQ